MGSKSNNASLALFFLLNLLFFAFASAQCAPPPTSSPPPPRPPPPPTPSPSTGTCPIDVLKLRVCVDLLPGLINVIIGRPPVNPCCSLIGGLVNLEVPQTPSPSTGTFPIDALKLRVCVDFLSGLINVTIGRPPVNPCCSLIGGLVNLEAAVCLCTVLKANVFGLPVSIPVALSLLLNNCGKTTPPGFQCP
ncbi:pEARLI1-like lipid transfer protein 2 [Camellia lanceoleosa]|uniref:PEARLI1-like lipid transfer protein 2 n=1 Tax=Camellia lanceoleosa TaxID=1840588 RepID=A0ACC0G2L1_9ERIC|nr:pEARLI1-like lipid transfer protein 2 [Camellia lanceoleosa]